MDRQTDTGQSDPCVPVCRHALQATQQFDMKMQMANEDDLLSETSEKS